MIVDGDQNRSHRPAPGARRLRPRRPHADAGQRRHARRTSARARRGGSRTPTTATTPSRPRSYALYAARTRGRRCRAASRPCSRSAPGRQERSRRHRPRRPSGPRDPDRARADRRRQAHPDQMRAAVRSSLPDGRGRRESLRVGEHPHRRRTDDVAGADERHLRRGEDAPTSASSSTRRPGGIRRAVLAGSLVDEHGVLIGQPEPN